MGRYSGPCEDWAGVLRVRVCIWSEAGDAGSLGVRQLDRIDDNELHRFARFGVGDRRFNLQVFTAVFLGELALEQPSGCSP